MFNSYITYVQRVESILDTYQIHVSDDDSVAPPKDIYVSLHGDSKLRPIANFVPTVRQIIS